MGRDARYPGAEGKQRDQTGTHAAASTRVRRLDEERLRLRNQRFRWLVIYYPYTIEFIHQLLEYATTSKMLLYNPRVPVSARYGLNQLTVYWQKCLHTFKFTEPQSCSIFHELIREF